jgi:hypothetical protein
MFIEVFWVKKIILKQKKTLCFFQRSGRRILHKADDLSSAIIFIKKKNKVNNLSSTPIRNFLKKKTRFRSIGWVDVFCPMYLGSFFFLKFCCFMFELKKLIKKLLNLIKFMNRVIGLMGSSVTFKLLFFFFNIFCPSI